MLYNRKVRKMKYNEYKFEGDVIFRYRSTTALFKHLELENSEIYFCPFDEEDDVFEGTINLYWQADEILWDNFFSHYLLVMWYHYRTLIMTEDDERTVPERIEWRIDRKKVNFEKEIYEFLDTKIVKAVKKIAMKANHKVQPDEMKLYLRLININAFRIISNSFGMNFTYTDISEDYNIDNDEWFDDAEIVFSALNSIVDNSLDKFLVKNTVDKFIRWFLFEFPLKYYNILNEMIFPKWYIASFCKTCTDGRNWAQYGDNHKGVCLVFKTHDSSYGKGLKLKVCNAYSSTQGKIYNYTIEPLRTVNYIDSNQEYNFFNMLGTMPGAILTSWMKDRNGNLSEFYKERGTCEHEKWRTEYWEYFESLITSKSTDWNGLAEERIVLEDNMLVKYNTIENRKIKYDFNDLKGIIFGCKTPEKDKQKIKGIISQKCKIIDRQNFEFYKAEKNAKTGRVIILKEN